MRGGFNQRLVRVHRLSLSVIGSSREKTDNYGSQSVADTARDKQGECALIPSGTDSGGQHRNHKDKSYEEPGDVYRIHGYPLCRWRL